MPYTEDNHQLIEAYFTNRLNAVDKQAFEDRYAQDDDFAQQVLFYRMTELAADEVQKEQLIHKFQKNNRQRNFIIVSFVVLLVSILSWLIVISINTPPKEPPVFANNDISTIIDKSVVLGEKGEVDWQKVAFETDDSNIKLDLQTGIDAYYNEDYSTAIQKLTPLSSELPMATFYRGAAYFKQKNYDAALTDFTNTEEQVLDNLELIFEARWFSALTYIQTQQNDLAIEKLELLEASDKYKDKAQLLIDELNQ